MSCSGATNLERNILLRLDDFEPADFFAVNLNDGSDFHERFVFFNQSMVRLLEGSLYNGHRNSV